MSNHTPEPWRITTHLSSDLTHIVSRIDGEKHAVCIIRTNNAEEAEANAARIVACVNACAGMADPQVAISQMAYERDKSKQERDKAEAERDEHQQAVIQWERLMFELVGEDGPKSVREAVESLKAERDELLAVLEAFPGFTDDATVGDPWIESMSKAIAKVKGGQP